MVATMIDSKRLLPLTGPRLALGAQLDRLEQLGLPMTCPRIDLDQGELRQLRRRLDELRDDTPDPSNRPSSGS